MRYRVQFRSRLIPLEACAVLALGDVADRLRLRLLDREPETLSRLEGVEGEGLLALRGACGDLPWCEGIRYFGAAPNAAPLLLPVELETDVPAQWLHALIPGSGPRIVAPTRTGMLIVPMLEARSVDRELLSGYTP